MKSDTSMNMKHMVDQQIAGDTSVKFTITNGFEVRFVANCVLRDKSVELRI